MRWFYDRKTSTKLVMGFALMTLITGGTGWYATITLREINANVDNLYQVQLLPSTELADMRGLTHQLRTNMYRSLVATGPAELQPILAEQQELKRQLAEKQEQFNPTEDGFQEF